ncbi:hypothetical protein DMN91_003373, partial [Ooceraea biroi]
MLAGMLNVLIVALVLHIAGQIDIMCYELLKILVAENKCNSRIITLRSIVIIREQTSKAFRSIPIKMLVKLVPYYFFVNVEMFIPCFTGEYLSSK